MTGTTFQSQTRTADCKEANCKQVFQIRKPGLLTTIQDLGRFGYRSAGLPVSGAADKFALRTGNILLGNAQNCAALEITLLGPELEVLTTTRLALAGADLGVTISGRSVPAWSSFTAYKGDVLRFRQPQDKHDTHRNGASGSAIGCRAYLCVEGGIEVADAFGSKSTDMSIGLGGIDGRALQSGDVIAAPDGETGAQEVGSTDSHDAAGWDLDALRQLRYIRPHIITYMDDPVTVRVIEGPQRNHFTEHAWAALTQSEYTAAPDSNRVGVRLDGPVLNHNERGADILSEPIPEGAIQVPKSGQPIALLADHRTVGGYAKIATAISADVPKLAQLRPGDRVRFQAVSTAQAQALLLKQRRWLRQMQRCWRE